MSPAKFLYPLLLSFAIFVPLKAQYAETSVLATGEIFKFAVQNTGIYKMDYNFLSSVEGLDIDNLDPRNIHIYSQHGGLVPQSLKESRIDDLREIPIKVIGEQDGVFDSGDYILIYVEGADRFVLDKQNIFFEKNVFDTNNYFFLKAEELPGLRMAESPAVSTQAYSNITESIRRHEIDRINLLGNFGSTQGSGKQWFGEGFAIERRQSFDESFIFSQLVPGATAEVEVNFVSRSSQTSSYEVRIDGQEMSRNVSPTNISNIEAVYARNGFIKEVINLENSNPSVEIEYLPRASNSEAWLDYIQIVSSEFLLYANEPLYLFRRDARLQDQFGFEIESPVDIEIWEISQQHGLHSLPTNKEGNQYRFAYTPEEESNLFLAFNDNDVTQKPVFVEQIQNQNLHGIQRADFIIVYADEFEGPALDLAAHRRNHDQLVVETIDIRDIYNEFGAGKQDPTALRDFVKMIYDRDPHFQYLLLLGDASYDYRGLVNGLDYQNFVPTYQTDESLHPVEAFPSDDFYALLSDNEGDDSLDGALDIGVGRIPCKTLSEAEAVIRKIIHYDTSPATLGDWRMRIGFAADDEDNNTHLRQADGVATLTAYNHPEFVQQKVYFDAFNQVSTPGGARYPDANEALTNNLSQGQLVLNYLGHGGPKGWAQERVFQVEDINKLSNFDRLPVMVTATCSFTGFDEPSVVSAGEQALLNPSGGAIALFSTVRAVYSSQNERITREVFKKIFTRSEGERLRLGDIIRQSQNANQSDTISSNTRKFLLFGDPAQTIAQPRYNIHLEQYNGEDINENTLDTLKALERGRLSGSIRDFNSAVINDFNGTVSISVFDKSTALNTLDNDGTGRVFEFEARQNILYKGSATVVNGRFEIEFILPRDINFDYGQGYMNLYASDGVSRDAGGYYDQLVIGGTADTAITDNEGPDINIYLNNRSFEAGDEVGANAILIVDLSDESGINLSTTSIGHDITAVIDDDINNPIVLNEFFSPTTDQTGSGTVVYALDGLSPGTHKLRIKAWDVLKNSSQEETFFIVTDSEEGFIKNVSNYPNPFNTSTTFRFEHDLVNSQLDISIDIYATNGMRVHTIERNIFSAGSRVDNIEWNKNELFTNDLGEGLYFYKININASELNLRRESKFNTLLISK